MKSPFDINLKQRGRASVDFMTGLFFGTASLRTHINESVSQLVPNIDNLPEDLDDRNQYFEEYLESDRIFRVSELVAEWHAREHGRVARTAFEELKDEIEPALQILDDGPVTLHLDTEFSPPKYWDGVVFHRTQGGWTEDYQGYVHGEIVHKKMVDALLTGSIFQQRIDVAAQNKGKDYSKILETGSSTGHYTLALSEVFPKADITGVELSEELLRHARRVGNSKGLSWELYQAPAESTPFEDDSFDFVTSYILLHETPPDIIKRIFDEAYRVLKPGGDMLMCDVRRYADMNKLEEWQADRSAMYGGEPHWRASAKSNLEKIAMDAGFVKVETQSIGHGGYLFIIKGQKHEQ